MKYLKYAVIYLFVFTIDTYLIDIISIKGITPDLILIFMIFVSLKAPQITATMTGFCGGLFQDLFAFGILGLSSLIKSLLCFITSYFQRLKNKQAIAYLAIIFFVITLIHDQVYQFILLLGTNQKLFRSFLYHSIPKALYTMTIALIINLLFHKFIWRTDQNQ
jgi:rod shape-determining protein MreD